jgi:8-oxo-dGTP pyrophosphatase MutT (NUDIX family)
MTSRSPALRRTAYRIFRWLPPAARRILVRTFTPNYTVGAVVMVRDSRGALLLLRQPPGHGWSLPGGLLGRRESPAQGAARELAEETGIEVAPEALEPANPNARVSTSAQQIDMIFTVTVDRAAVHLRVDPVEVLEAAWQNLDALPPLTVPTARVLAAYGIGPYVDYLGGKASTPDQPSAGSAPASP